MHDHYEADGGMADLRLVSDLQSCIDMAEAENDDYAEIVDISLFKVIKIRTIKYTQSPIFGEKAKKSIIWEDVKDDA